MIDQDFFLLYATLFLILYVIYDLFRYRKEERSLLQRFLFYSFVFYMINVIRLTLFPIMFMPTSFSVQFVPFFFMMESLDSGYIARTYLENFILLLPLGFYLPLLFQRFRKLKFTIFAAFILTTSIETIQLLMRLTIGSLRTFNVDDIILNTSGAILGYFLYKITMVIIKKYNYSVLKSFE
ncbi:glycopeptide antibiotics resistance protein [Natronobacillus azotifigens]|uniref:VanZ family protein n=1 Tax=Natronobacillus azotifigens TaxID=472978 RepID=A0A9J6RB22_9BACI|nr:VanZ family protein [Natronobacillus azotifigens]MCZ0702433.1 VanZ family protein [Natronobacillus azotifigens]